MTALLGTGEPHPAQTYNPNAASPFLLICEHASNFIPKALNQLGLEAQDLERHIAYDIGAAGVTQELARLLSCTAVMQRYSRLVYDCNRPPESPGAMPEKSEIFEVPGNRNLSAENKLDRIRTIYRPFMRWIDDLIDQRTLRDQKTVVISIHSFTPVYFGKNRSTEVGLLFDQHDALAHKLLNQFPEFRTRLNEPYGPQDGVMHLMNQIAAPRGLPHLMIEIRNDMITETEHQKQWAKRLADALSATV